LQKIAVIGAGGRMGSWFVNYFAHRQVVSVYDVNKSMLKASSNVRVSTSISDCVTDADFVLICVPVHLTPHVILECEKAMKAEAVIAEISSVKHRTFRALASVRNDLRPLCVHPMFGPGASEKKHAKILLVPVRNKDAETKIAYEMFDGATVIVLPDAKTHDKSIAMILGLTYFVNIIFAKVLADNDLSLLKEISGTTFGLQSMLAESILTDEPDLIVALIRDNPFAHRYIRQYIKEALAMARLISAKSSESLEVSLRKVMSQLQKWQDLQKSYRQMYEIAEGLR
jgi:prephenate dehydrogenase